MSNVAALFPHRRRTPLHAASAKIKKTRHFPSVGGVGKTLKLPSRGRAVHEESARTVQAFILSGAVAGMQCVTPAISNFGGAHLYFASVGRLPARHPDCTPT